MEGRRCRMVAGRSCSWVVLLVCIWAWNLSCANGDTNPTDASALNVLYGSLNSASQLNGWSLNGGDPCGQSWRGITCSGSSVTAIKLSGMGLTGNLGYQLNSMTSIVELDLSNNNLAGGINYNLPQSLQRLNLAGNSLNGSIPYSISQMPSLQYLNLGHNQLQGSINVYFESLTNLSTMDLSSNSLNGNLPDSLKSLSSLTTLYLQNNQFTGPIDVLTNLPLEDLNVVNNHFTGWIPDRLKKINNLQTDGNTWSSGSAPPPPPYATPPSGRRANPGQGSGNGSKSPSNGGGGGKSSGIGGGAIAGIIISILLISAIVAFFLIRRKQRKSLIKEIHDQDQSFTPLASNEVKVEMKPIQASSTIPTSTMQTTNWHPPAPISLKPPPIDRHRSYEEDDFSNKLLAKKTAKNPIKATSYSVADLQMATNSFSADNLIGEGSLGSVYRAQFNDGKVLAVKKIKSSALPNQSTEDFIELVTNISRLHHPSLTELVGYCSEHGQHLLVYEFQRNGSLHELIHLSDEYSEPLTWNARVKIALGSARALEYLHEVCSPSIVHKNLTSVNILLDMELNPHLSDCGLGSLLPNMEYQALDSGYSAPEVAMSGQYTMKSDVYSFGVVMLELLTGRKPFDSSRPRSEQSLVRWATPQLHDIDALDKMVDAALKGLYSAKSLSRFADVIALCVQPEPEFRPPMSEVVQSLVRLVQRANMSARLVGRDDTNRRADDADMQDTY